MKLKKPDVLPVISESLRTLMGKMADDGCPIARTITDALSRTHRYGGNHPAVQGDYDRLHCHRQNAWAYAIFNPSPIGSHFSYREKEGMISYCPKGRYQEVAEFGAWKREGRVEIKPAKFVRALLHPRLAKRYKDHQFAKFAERFSHREQEGKLSFSFESFEDGYDEARYPGGKIDSCMWGKNVGPFYRSYNAKCLVAKDGTGAFVARAVFWPSVKIDGQYVPVLDRIYAESPDITEAMISHARESGYWRKVKQSRMEKEWWMKPDGTTTFRTATIEQVKNFTGSFYPYMDTFSYYDVKNGWLYSYDNPGFEGFGLQSTMGDYGTTTGHGPVIRNYIRRFTK